jgi:Protein kinase domain
MTRPPGTRLGAYEILTPLGAGGMGEVYRARDTRLPRDVALKLLPETFASNPERVARFEREAHTLAALNHPHIAQVYGFERAESSQALVMELGWVDEAGNIIDTFGDPRPRSRLFLSRDKQRVVMTISDETTGVPSTWIYELESGREAKVNDGTNAVLSPDAESVAYRSPADPIGLRRSSTAGTRATTITGRMGFPTDWLPDGRGLLLMSPEPGQQFDVSLMDLDTKTMYAAHSHAGW